jgi:hypothetical protein
MSSGWFSAEKRAEFAVRHLLQEDGCKLAGRDRLRIIKVMFPSRDGTEANVVQSSGMKGRQHLGRREWH